MPNPQSSDSGERVSYSIAKIPDIVAILLMAGSIVFFIFARWANSGMCLVLLYTDIALLIANLFFTSRFWRSLSLMVLFIVGFAVAYIVCVVNPREEAKFQEKIAQAQQQAIFDLQQKK